MTGPGSAHPSSSSPVTPGDQVGGFPELPDSGPAFFRGRTPYLTPEEAAAYLKFSNVKAFRKWLDRSGVVKLRRGCRILVDRHDLDAKLREHLPTRRRWERIQRRES